MFGYIGLSLGDLCSGFISQRLRSRKKVVLIFLGLTTGLIGLLLFSGLRSAPVFYGLCVALGFAIGYWALFVTISAEQFGTNLRGTVSTTVPNFVRGSVNLLTPLFLWLQKGTSSFEISAGIVGGITIMLALAGLYKIRETYSADLNYLETRSGNEETYVNKSHL